jgi:hypothetical protein
VVSFSSKNESQASKVLFLKWSNDHSIVNDRFNKVKTFLENVGQPFTEIVNCDSSLVIGILSSIYSLDYSTIYMAINRHVDPSVTPAVDILEKKSVELPVSCTERVH